MAHYHTNHRQVAIGMASLMAGAGVYLLGRPIDRVWFVPSVLGLHGATPYLHIYGAGQMPAFAHVVGLSLITAGLIGGHRRSAAWICVAWFLLNAGFELGQRAEISARLVSRVPAWFDHVWLLANSRTYFARGTFDPFDIAAAAAGAAWAYLIIHHTQPKGNTV